MDAHVYAFHEIQNGIRPIAQSYGIQEIYLFGSYARDEATPESDLDVLVIGGDAFKRTPIFAFAEDLRVLFDKKIDAFEISEINPDSDFCKRIMKERKRLS